MISVVIPARNEIYLQKTIDDLTTKAKGEIEIITVLDGYWPDPILKDQPNLVLLHNTTPKGMRAAINDAVRISKGEYIMKVDGHCMFADGYDVVLANDCQKDWLLVPSRYSLTAETWERGRGPIDYLYLTYPFFDDDQFGYGLHGKKWLAIEGNMGGKSYYGLEEARKDILLDDIMTFQGSCWVMHKEYFVNTIGMLDENWYNMYQEAQEMAFKTWFSGGRCVLTKNTWYAHWHKTSNGYGLSKKEKLKSENESVEYWLQNKWPGAVRKFEWLIDKFWPVPSWPENWKSEVYK
jgi:glycosyltransferase involved in cell wall biosynthesis